MCDSRSCSAEEMKILRGEEAVDESHLNYDGSLGLDDGNSTDPSELGLGSEPSQDDIRGVSKDTLRRSNAGGGGLGGGKVRVCVCLGSEMCRK